MAMLDIPQEFRSDDNYSVTDTESSDIFDPSADDTPGTITDVGGGDKNGNDGNGGILENPAWTAVSLSPLTSWLTTSDTIEPPKGTPEYPSTGEVVGDTTDTVGDAVGGFGDWAAGGVGDVADDAAGAVPWTKLAVIALGAITLSAFASSVAEGLTT